MPEIKIKTQIYKINPTRDSFTRRAIQYTNLINEKLRRFGLGENDVDISEERLVIKRAPASISWWIEDSHCHFSYNKMTKYVDNLLVVWKVIERHVNLVEAGEMTVSEFINTFKENNDVNEERTAAREFFGLDENHVDLDSITKAYKKLAKTLHPDMSTGDIDKFKELNHYHKVLKRELE